MTQGEGEIGRFLEDFRVGDVYRHPLGRTMTDADNSWFTLLTMNTNQLHFNHHYAEQTAFGKPLVNSALTLAMVVGMSVIDVSQYAVANLGWERIELPHPVFIGDTLYAESLVLDIRRSRSRPHAGIVHVRTRGLNQDGVTCITFDRKVMVHRRDSNELPVSFPQPQTPIEELE